VRAGPRWRWSHSQQSSLQLLTCDSLGNEKNFNVLAKRFQIGFIYNRGDAGLFDVHGTNGVGVHGKEDDGRGNVQFAEFAGSLQAVHARHLEIENNEVGIEVASFFESVETVNRFAADFELRLVFQKVASCRADYRAVVHDENGLSHRHLKTKVTANKLESALGTLPYQTPDTSAIGRITYYFKKLTTPVGFRSSCDLLDAVRSGGYTDGFQSSMFSSKRGCSRGC